MFPALLSLGLGMPTGCADGRSPTTDTADRGPGRPVSLGLKLSGAREGELAGVAVAGNFDLNGDAQSDVAIGAMLSDAKNESSGRACVFLGRVRKDTTLKRADLCLHGSGENHLFGRDIEGLDDLDGDGFDELGIGAVHDDQGGQNSGVVVVIWGAADLSTPVASEVWGTDSGGHAGLRFAPVPGDSPRFVVGAHEANLDAQDGEELRGEGVAWIVDTPPRGERVPLSDVARRWTGEREDDRAGVSVSSPGDLDGDGLADVLIGASQARTSDPGDQVGAVYVVLSPFEHDGSLADADAVVHGTTDRAWFGWAVAGLGDVDGDGLGDFATSAFKDGTNGPDAGAVYVFSGLPSPGDDLSTAGGVLLGEWEGDKAGEVLEPGGDLDGDGHQELLVGAPTAGHRRTWAGALYAVRGPFVGVRDLGEPEDDLWVGTEDLQFVGSSAAAAGDIGGSQAPDVIVGAMGDTTSIGAAFLLLEVGW